MVSAFCHAGWSLFSCLLFEKEKVGRDVQFHVMKFLYFLLSTHTTFISKHNIIYNKIQHML